LHPREPKRLLYIAQHAWASPIKVGSHAIATHFLESGWKVAYISAPISPFHFLRPNRSSFKERLKAMLSGGGKEFEGYLSHFVPFSLITPGNKIFNNANWIINYWQILSIPNVLRKLTKHGFGEVDTIFIDSIYQPFWLDVIKYDKCIVRLADFNDGFKGFGRGAMRSQKKIIYAADLVVTASKSLGIDIRKNFSKRNLHISNGVDIKRFSNFLPAPAEYQSMTGAIAVFVGDINFWVDLEIIAYCAGVLTDVNFVLIGPKFNQYLGMHLPANVHFLGTRGYDDVPAYLLHATVGLIPFHFNKHQPLITHINPLKLYEYLGAGIPVVSTFLPEVDGISDHVRFCKSKEEFLIALQDFLRAPPLKEIVSEGAQDYSWEERLRPLFAWLDSNG